MRGGPRTHRGEKKQRGWKVGTVRVVASRAQSWVASAPQAGSGVNLKAQHSVHTVINIHSGP